MGGWRGWQVSTECLDLLTRILVADPERRLSMTAIQTHPWFRIGLPKGTEDMNRFYAAQCTAPEQVRTPPSPSPHHALCGQHTIRPAAFTQHPAASDCESFKQHGITWCLMIIVVHDYAYRCSDH